MWHLYKPFSLHGTGTETVVLDYGVEGRGRVATWVGEAVYFLLLPFGVVGLVVLARRRIPISPLVAQFASVTLTAALTFGVTRYRVPADAALVLAAAVAGDSLLRRWWPAPDDGSISPRPRSTG
jgi:hypothetical protein